MSLRTAGKLCQSLMEESYWEYKAAKCNGLVEPFVRKAQAAEKDFLTSVYAFQCQD